MDYLVSVCRIAVEVVSAAHTSLAHIVHKRKSKSLKCFRSSCSLSQGAAYDANGGKFSELTAMDIFTNNRATSLTMRFSSLHFLFFMASVVWDSLIIHDCHSSVSVSEDYEQIPMVHQPEKCEALMKIEAKLLKDYKLGIWSMYNVTPSKDLAAYTSYCTASYDDHGRVFLELNAVDIFIINCALLLTGRFPSLHFSFLLKLVVVSNSLLLYAFYHYKHIFEEDYVQSLMVPLLEKRAALTGSKAERLNTYGSDYLSICHAIPYTDLASSSFDYTVESSAARDNEIYLTDTDELYVEKPSDPNKCVDWDTRTTRQNEISLTNAEEFYSETPMEHKNRSSFEEETGTFNLPTATYAVIASYARSSAIRFLSLQVFIVLQRSVFCSALSRGLQHGGSVYEEESIQNTVAMFPDDYQKTTISISRRLGRYGLGFRSARDVVKPAELAPAALYCTASFEEETGAIALPSASNDVTSAYARSCAIRFHSLQVLFLLQPSVFNSLLSRIHQHDESVYEEECNRTILVGDFSDDYHYVTRSERQRLGICGLCFSSKRDVIQPAELALVALFCSDSFEEESITFVLPTAKNAVIVSYARSSAIRFLSLQVLTVLQRSVFSSLLSRGLHHHGGTIYKKECFRRIAAVLSEEYQTFSRSNSQCLVRYGSAFLSIRIVIQPADPSFAALFCTALFEEEIGRYFFAIGMETCTYTQLLPIPFLSLHILCILPWMVLSAALGCGLHHRKSVRERECLQSVVKLSPKDDQTFSRNDAARLRTYGSHCWSIRNATLRKELNFVDTGQHMQRILALYPEDLQTPTRSDTEHLSTYGSRFWSIPDVKQPIDQADVSHLYIGATLNCCYEYSLVRKKSSDSTLNLQTQHYRLPRYLYRAFYGEFTERNVSIYAVVCNNPGCQGNMPIQVEDLNSGTQPVDDVEMIGVQPAGDRENVGAHSVLNNITPDSRGDDEGDHDLPL